ncbi:hypothetical protein [Isoptericola sp. NPDC060257]|uniref:hypothetical protein n=1 Tax=Isoptericola sp. NPDC060257 TaxID=3347087 RepID=UPI0036473C9A
MSKFIINEGMFDPVPKKEVEANTYEEKGSFTEFYDGSGHLVFSIRTDSLFTIRSE